MQRKSRIAAKFVNVMDKVVEVRPQPIKPVIKVVR